MPVAHSFVLFVAFFSTFCLSKPFRALVSGAIDSPNWNTTSISISTTKPIIVSDAAPFSSLPTVEPQHSTLGAGTPNATTTKDRGRPPKNDTCGSCTVHVPQAILNWWYPATFTHNIGTLIEFKSAFNLTPTGTYATLVSATEPFDVATAISGDDVQVLRSSSTTESWNGLSYEWEWMDPYTVKPTAQTTSVVTRTAALPLPSGDIFPANDLMLYDLNPTVLPLAEVAVTGATGTLFVATSTTPFLYFSAYVVETNVPTTLANGKVEVASSTQTFELGDIHVYAIDEEDVENVPVASGLVPRDFLKRIPHSLCSAGSYTAVVTVLVVVDLTYWEEIGVEGDPLLVHVEKTVSDFEDVVHVKTADSRPNAIAVMPDPTSTSPKTTESIHVEASVSPNKSHADGSGGSNVAPAVIPTGATFDIVGLAPVKLGQSSEVIIGSQTLKPGSVILVSGTPVSLAPSGTAPAIVVGGTTSVLTSPSTSYRPPPILTIGSSTFTGNAATQFFLIPGQTLTPGGTALLNGTPIHLAPSAEYVVIGPTTQVLPTTPPPLQTAAQILLGDETIIASPDPSTFVISGQTLVPGRTITIAIGTTLVLDSLASTVLINGIPQPVTKVPIPAPPTITLGAQTFTPLSGPNGPTYVIDGQTLTPSGTITIGPSTISLSPSASVILVNGVPTTLFSLPSTTNPPILTIGASTYYAVSSGGTTYVIYGQTLTPGGAVMLDGMTIRLEAGATRLVVGNAGEEWASTLFPATETKTGTEAEKTATRTGTGTDVAGETGVPKETAKTGVGTSLNVRKDVLGLVFVGVLGSVVW